jgi:hypothetical protein
MRSIRVLGLGFGCALTLGATLCGDATAIESNLKMLPEVGRCVRIGAEAEFRSVKCARSEPGVGRYAWLSGAGPKNKFAAKTSVIKLQSAGDVITCFAGSGAGEYTGAKNLKFTTLVLEGCEQSAKSGIESFCQNELGSKNGQIAFKELEGELGFISHPKKLKVAWELKPASGASLATFECGGANATLEKSVGTGIKRELQGSVMGRVLPLNTASFEYTLTYQQAKTGGQYPERFEGGVRDTLTTLVEVKVAEKAPEATVLLGELKLKDEEALEALGKCVGRGC